MALAEPMNDSSPHAGDPGALRERMQRDGYLYFPSLLPREAVLAGCRRFCTEVGPAVRPGAVEGTVCVGDPSASGDYGIIAGDKVDVLLADPAIRAVVGHPELIAVFEQLFGESVVAYDYKWLRFVVPGASTDFHMDSCFFGRSEAGGPLDNRLVTCWFPWCDLAADVGGITLLEGSSRCAGFERLRRTYGDTFDVCNSDIRSPYVAGLPKGDVSINDGINTADVPPLSPDELQSFDPEARWVAGRGTGGYRAGDIVIFHKYCVHGSTVNVSADSVRLSTDVRFQPSSDPVDYRHTATPGREVSLCTQSAAQMRQLRELFNERKKGPPRPPAHRSMGEALREWGIAQPTRSRAAAL